MVVAKAEAVAMREAIAVREVKQQAAAEVEALVKQEVHSEQVATTTAAGAVVDSVQVSEVVAAAGQVSPHLLILVED